MPLLSNLGQRGDYGWLQKFSCENSLDLALPCCTPPFGALLDRFPAVVSPDSDASHDDSKGGAALAVAATPSVIDSARAPVTIHFRMGASLQCWPALAGRRLTS